MSDSMLCTPEARVSQCPGGRSGPGTSVSPSDPVPKPGTSEPHPRIVTFAHDRPTGPNRIVINEKSNGCSSEYCADKFSRVWRAQQGQVNRHRTKKQHPSDECSDPQDEYRCHRQEQSQMLPR